MSRPARATGGAGGLAARRSAEGRSAGLAGRAAEEIAERLYLELGGRIAARRWRCPGGEIDLVVELGGETVFVEVKARRRRAAAALALRPSQAARLAAAAEIYLQGHGCGPCRFDIVLIDRSGQAERIENALSFDDF